MTAITAMYEYEIERAVCERARMAPPDEIAAAAMCFIAAAHSAIDYDGRLYAGLWPGWDCPPSPTDPPEVLLRVARSLLSADLERLELFYSQKD